MTFQQNINQFRVPSHISNLLYWNSIETNFTNHDLTQINNFLNKKI